MESHLNMSTQFFNYYCDGEDYAVRVAGTSEQPLFCARDVCLILGLENTSRACARLKPDELTLTESNTSAGRRQLTFITESGLYRLIFTSSKPEAEFFKDWVFSEVLPSLRKRGEYKLNDQKEALEIKDMQMSLIKKGIELLKSIDCFDDRARSMVQSNALNLLEGNSEEISKEYSVSRRVQERYGKALSSKKDTSLLLRIGRELAKTYREVNQRSPMVREQYVAGTLRPVKHYTQKDFEDFGDAILDRYFGEE